MGTPDVDGPVQSAAKDQRQGRIGASVFQQRGAPRALRDAEPEAAAVPRDPEGLQRGGSMGHRPHGEIRNRGRRRVHRSTASRAQGMYVCQHDKGSYWTWRD